jgi:hypothetical protein
MGSAFHGILSLEKRMGFSSIKAVAIVRRQGRGRAPGDQRGRRKTQMAMGTRTSSSAT